jgi:hypothetical protein
VTVTLNGSNATLAIGKHHVATGAIDRANMRLWLSYNDPHPSWYKTYSSAAYMIEYLPYRKFRLSPFKGRVVYTFDTWGEIIAASRNLPVELMFTGDFDASTKVPVYRARSGPPVEHVMYPLPPHWNYT